MALLFMDGFDAGDMAQRYTLISGSAASNTTTRFTAGRSVGLSGTLRKTLTAASKVIVGAGWYWDFTDGNDRMWCKLLGDNALTTHLTIAQNNGRIVLYRGTTNLATSLSVVPKNTWNYIEISATIDSTAGAVEIRCNGITLINFTGNTKNGGTNTTIDAVDIGATGGANFLMDDLYIADGTGATPYNTFLGDVRIRSLSPTAAGSSTQFTPSTGANYTTVDELPYSATDYVTSGTSGQRDTYAMADLPTNTGPILAVQNTYIAKKTDSGPISLKPAVKSGTTTYYGTSSILGPYDQTYSDLRTVDPATGAAWTNTGVNSLEAGFEVV